MMQIRNLTVAFLLSMLGACAPLHQEKFTYVIVHGAYGGGWGFRQVGAMLTADGHTVYRPTLTGQGERVHLANPDVDLNTHIQDVVNTIEFEDLHDIVLVGHSYGGMVITGVADRIPGRIKQIIYLDAFLPEDGESVQTVTGHSPYRPGVIPNKKGYIVPTWINQKDKLPHDEPQPGKTFTQPITLTNQAAAQAIPTTYVLYVPQGKQVWDATFYDSYTRARCRHWPTKTLTSTHNAQWTHPAELVKLLEEIP
jgi:pimeloyl-ACP methyl ester carboxylesterase